MKLMSFVERFGWDTAAHVTHLQWTRNADLIVEINAHPFWLEQPSTEDQKSLNIRFHDVVESCIDLDWDNVELDLRVSALDPLLWHYGQFATVYASSPVPDPQTFLTAFLDKCFELGVVRDCIQYLNAEMGLERWSEIIQGSSSAILRAPVKLCDAAQELLRCQNARFTVVAGPPRDHAWAREAV